MLTRRLSNSCGRCSICFHSGWIQDGAPLLAYRRSGRADCARDTMATAVTIGVARRERSARRRSLRVAENLRRINSRRAVGGQPSTIEKIAVFAPMASASERTATVVTMRVARRERRRDGDRSSEFQIAGCRLYSLNLKSEI